MDRSLLKKEKRAQLEIGRIHTATEEAWQEAEPQRRHAMQERLVAETVGRLDEMTVAS
jgi:hypothetical protein